MNVMNVVEMSEPASNLEVEDMEEPENNDLDQHSDNFIGNDSAHELILCIYFRKHYFSVACYHTGSCELSFINSVYEDESLACEYMDSLYEQINPTIIITNSNAADTLIDYLKTLVMSDEAKPVTFHIIAGRYFKYELCKEKVLQADFVFVRNREIQNKHLYIKSSLDFSHESLISSVGGLLFYLESNHTSSPEVRKIIPLSLKNFMVMNERTMLEIQVFDPLDHPSSFKWSSKGHREGLSICSMMQEVCGRISRPGLRLFLSRPTNNPDKLKERYEVIRFMVDPKHQTFVHNLRRILHNMAPLSVFLKKSSTISLNAKNWKTTYRNIHFAARAAEMCKEYAHCVPYFKKVAAFLTGELYGLANRIYNTIDFDAMENSINKYIIKHGIKQELDDAKAKVDLLQKTIDAVIPYEFKILPSFIDKIQLVYISELLFLLQIPFWSDDLTEEELHLPNVEYQFSSNRTAYYKSKRCREMDRLIGDPLLEILEIETEIALGLLGCINKFHPFLISFHRKLAELDCLASLAVLAHEYNYTEPELVEENSIIIEEGKHPLVSRRTDFVPNDFISKEGSRIKLLQGPNSSGKTIYIKQIALIVYMAHIGSFVPAKKLSLPVMDHVEVLLHTYESLATGTSAFFSELITLCSMMNHVGGRRLLLVDEIGKSSEEGCAIVFGRSLLEYYLDFPEQPHLLVTSHHKIVDTCFNPPQLKVFGMEYIVCQDDVTFSYKVQEGFPHKSFTFEVAQKNGFPAEEIYAAKLVLKWLNSGQRGPFPPKLCEVKRYLRLKELFRQFCSLDLNDKSQEELTNLLSQLQANIKKIFMDTQSRNPGHSNPTY